MEHSRSKTFPEQRVKRIRRLLRTMRCEGQQSTAPDTVCARVLSCVYVCSNTFGNLFPGDHPAGCLFGLPFAEALWEFKWSPWRSLEGRFKGTIFATSLGHHYGAVKANVRCSKSLLDTSSTILWIFDASLRRLCYPEYFQFDAPR